MFEFIGINGLLLVLIINPISGRKGFGRHTYPKSGGLSGGAPHSGGLSGDSHGYQLSNKGHSHNYHYPQKIPCTPSHAAAPNYHYPPSQRFSHTPSHGAAPTSYPNYPVYSGQPPNYVHQYKESGSKYGPLLAGLALLNLGALAGTVYAHSRTPSQPGEVCKFAVKKENGDYEETKIDCKIISSFNMQDKIKTAGKNSTSNMVREASNQTAVAASTELYAKMPDGSLVPVNRTVQSANEAAKDSSVTAATTVANALDVKGKPIDVTPGMKCFVMRNSPTSTMKKSVPCGLLQTYADKTVHRNSASLHSTMFNLMATILAYCLAKTLGIR